MKEGVKTKDYVSPITKETECCMNGNEFSIRKKSGLRNPERIQMDCNSRNRQNRESDPTWETQPNKTDRSNPTWGNATV